MISKHIAAALVATVLVTGGLLSPAHGTTVIHPVGAGHDIAFPGDGYRYGPALITNPDGSIDMWACSQGSGSSWDYIRHSKSTDDGATFGDDQIVLEPTKDTGSRDFSSVCDPGVAKFGGYYYLAYTAVAYSANAQYPLIGNPNHVFVARSTSAAGPFEKWNGTGWGGSPQPFISYFGTDDAYGIGEPSLVIKDSLLYIYYSEYTAISTKTLVATASIVSGNWPGAVTLLGTAIDRSVSGLGIDADIHDSTDHKYVPSLGKFIAVGFTKRLTYDSYIQVYESTDGITYTPQSQITQGLQPWGHNMGITGNELGQFDPTAHNYLAYPHGFAYGTWKIYLQPFNLVNAASSATVERNHSAGTYVNYSDISAWVSRVQPFHVDGTTLSELKVWGYRQGNPTGPLEIKVFALDPANKLVGFPLSTHVLAASSVSASPGWISLKPGLTNLTPGAAYGFVLASPKSAFGGGTDAYGWGYNDANLYPGYDESYSMDGGSTWTTEGGRSLKFVSYTASTVDRDGTVGSFTNYADIGVTTHRMQTFTVSSQTISGVDIWTSRTSSDAGDLKLSVFAADASNNPTGGALWSIQIHPQSVSTTFGWLRVYPNLTGLTVGGKYALVMSSSAGSGAFGWAYTDANPFPTGLERYSINAGASWTSETSRDLKMITYK